jgi:hypothetical protein
MLEKLLSSKSFGTIVDHFACCQIILLASSMVRPSFSGLTCYSRLLRMLGFDCSYINFSFLVGGLPYSFWCGGTCKDQYLSLLGNTTKYLCDVTWGHPITCLAFRDFSGAILFSNVVLFYGPTTWIGIYFAYSRCSFRCCASTSLFLCRSNNKDLVINSS